MQMHVIDKGTQMDESNITDILDKLIQTDREIRREIRFQVIMSMIRYLTVILLISFPIIEFSKVMWRYISTLGGN